MDGNVEKRGRLPQRIRPAFTLMEMLVVIGAIAVLLAIFVPVFARREGQGRASCLSNLKQLAAAGIQYAADHDNTNLWYRGRPDSVVVGARGENVPPWQLGGDNYNMTMQAAFAPYVTSTSPWYCPSDPYARQHTFAGYSGGAGGSRDSGYGESLTRLSTISDARFGGTQWSSQLFMDHYYGSYRFYSSSAGDPSAPTYDAPPASRFDVSFQKMVTGRSSPITINSHNYVLFLEEYNVHAPTNRWFGSGLGIYGRNAAYRDGHASYTTTNEFTVR